MPRNHSNLSAALIALGSLLVSLLLCDVGELDSFLILIVVVVQTFSGMLIYRRASKTSITLSAEFIGMGFAIGSFLAMAGDQLFINTRLMSVGWLLPMFVGILCLCDFKNTFSVPPLKASEALTLPWAISGAFVALGIEWYWTLPIGLALALFVSTFESELNIKMLRVFKLHKVFAIVCMAFLALLMILLRPKIWWMQHTYDYIQFENWSSGLANFGRVGIGGVGYEFSYHWFSFAWSGMTSRLSNAQPWVMTTRASVLIGAVAVQLMLVAIIDCYLKNRIAARITSVVVALFSTVAIWNGDGFYLIHLESFSLFFSVIWLMAVYLLLLKIRSSFSAPLAALVIILSVASLGGKTAFGAIAICMSGSLFLEVFLTRRRQALPYFLLAILTFLMILFFSTLWFVNSDLPEIYRPSLGFFDLLGDLESENRIFRKPETLVMALGWLSAGFLIQVSACLTYVKRMYSSTKRPKVFEILTLILVILMTSFITFYAASQIYFAYAGFVLFLPLVAVELVTQFEDVRNHGFMRLPRKRLLIVSILVIVLVASSKFWPKNSIGVDVSWKVALRHSPYLLNIIVVCVTLVLVLWPTQVRNRLPQTFMSKLLIASLALSSVTLFFTEWVIDIKPAYLRWNAEEASNSLYQNELISEQEVADWVNQYSARDSVFATNYKYSECFMCPVTSWAVNTRLPIEVEVMEGLIHRRLLVRQQNLFNAGIEIVSSPRISDLTKKKLAISYFANTGSSEALKDLQNYGVNFVLISLKDTSRRDWGSSVTRRFENSNFVVLELGKKDL